MKAFTDLEQSKKLAKILPLESADMGYLWNGTSFCEYPVSNQTIFNRIENIHCWSLVALLEVLPNGIVMNKDSQNGKYHFSSKYVGTYLTADNPIDGCYELILKLHELKML